MKILHTSDWHVGKRIRGRDRSDEHGAVLAEIAGLASTREVDLTIVAGDLFDSSSPTPRAEEIVWRTLLDLAEVSPVVVVAGNHDSPERLDAVTPLLEMGRVRVVGSPRPPEHGGVVGHPELPARIALLPFVSQRSIVKAEDIMGSDPDQHAGAYQDRLQRLVDRLTAEMTTDTVNVLVGHLTVYGAMTGGGERTAHIFGYAIPAGIFPGHLSYVALGHLHRQQKMQHMSQVWYSGSPLQLDFGEVGDTKGVLVVDVSPGEPASVEQVPLAAGRRLVTVTGTLEQVLERAEEVSNDYVKVVLTERGRVGLADEVRRAIPDAVDVVLESPEPEQKVPREPRHSLEPSEAFHRYLSERGESDTRVEAMFAELLDEATG